MAEKVINDGKVGAVLVAGGGIAGIQAALDLADSGYKVYLVESGPAIGGGMVQLDKTFPTGDCSMCMISPKLVECGRHRNIEIITGADVEAIHGEAGNFSATVTKRPRYVDETKCNGCGDCEKACPVEMDDFFEEGLADRKAVYRLYPQAVPGAYAINKRGTSPCRLTCPAGINPQGYVALIYQRKFDKAIELIREVTPFAGILGRVCTHPCEGECERGKVDDAIAIRALKRFVADWEKAGRDSGISRAGIPPVGNTSTAPTASAPVAIVGGGPTGLTAAYHLARMGHSVTVFEKFPVAGGMLRLGIPSFRLPKDIVDYETDLVRKLGVEIKTGVAVGKDVSFRELREKYRAIFVAVGAIESGRLRIEGENLGGVLNAIDFLVATNLEKKPEVGRKVAIVGGGNTALDAARTALRLGAGDVRIIYRRSTEEMPATPEEIDEALEEGVKIDYLVAPRKIIGTADRVGAIECVRMRLGEPDKDGRRKPEPIAGSEFRVEADTVILAINRYADLRFLPKEIEIDKAGNLAVDPMTHATNIPGIFAGGDVTSGPDILVKAVAAGKEAAISINRYLKGLDLKEGRSAGPPARDRELIRREHFEQRKRGHIPLRAKRERIRSFAEVELGFDQATAIEEARRCLSCGGCSECFECVKACKPQAIDHRMPEKEIELRVGAVVLAPGVARFDARLRGEYGCGRFKNVITGIQFERILSASGPFRGEVKRPSDGKHPRKIAFIQCVGSRDVRTSSTYCSAVCCMYATKQAIIAREHDKDIHSTVFFIDMRTFGKGFERYLQRAKDEYGVRYVRCMISKVAEDRATGNLKLKYLAAEGELREEEFDLVVLSVGLSPDRRAVELANRLGVRLNRFGFCETDVFSPVETNLPGIFVAGAFQSPKDIPESVVQGSAAAGSAGALVAEARGREVSPKAYPEETDVRGVEPRIGVFICHCGINIASTVDVKSVVEYAAALPHVVCAEDVLYACSQDSQQNMRRKIEELRLNRVVVASCTPRTHEPLFQETIREAGLNKRLFELANIREQCSWVHSATPAEATSKAKALVAMTVAKARLLEPVQANSVAVTPIALVIGGGLAGMTVSLGLASQGFEVHLVEKEEALGGNLRHLQRTLEGRDVRAYLKSLVARVEGSAKIRVHTSSAVRDVQGYIGNFTSALDTRQPHAGEISEQTIRHGVVVVATGGVEHRPTEYLYGQDDRILTQREIEEMMAAGTLGLTAATSVVMIQCVGSREKDRPWCSRICCAHAIKNALKIKELQPGAAVHILYRDVRTYGLKEDYYRQAREKGIVFVRYDETRKPEVRRESDGVLRVTVYDQLQMEEVALRPDKVVLSAGVTPASTNRQLSEMLKVPVDQDGFFLEAHVKLRPVDFANEGIFLCGLAHSPRSVDETISQAMAVVGQATRIMSRGRLEVAGVVAVIDSDKCATCLTCLRLCPYNAPAINELGKMEISGIKCQGCGICAAECPATAIQVQQFKDEQIAAMIDSLPICSQSGEDFY